MKPPATANEAAPIDERNPMVLGCAPSHGVGRLALEVDLG